MYYAISYHLKEGKPAEYQKWLLSEEAKQLFANMQEETGLRYLETYWSILGFGEYACEDWWEVPNWAALDKMRESQAVEKLVAHFQDFADGTRGHQTRMLRSTQDVRVPSPPKQVEK